MSKSTETLDARWFEKLTSLNVIDDAEWLTNYMQVAAIERERFLHDEIENPQFTYLQRPDQYQKTYDAYQSLREEIERSEDNIFVRELYVKKITAQMQRVTMLQTTQRGDDQLFHELSIALHGKPKKTLFAMVALHVQGICTRATTPSQVRTAKRLKKIFSKIDTTTAALSTDVLPPVVEAKKQHVVSAAEVAAIFKEVIDWYEIDGWSVVVDTSGNRSRFSVHVSTKQINIPSDAQLRRRRYVMTALRARAIAEHEVGVHVRRAVEGGSQRLQLLGIGLRGYLRGEEGLASYVQQQVEGANDYYGVDRYLAICLAMGMDGSKRDFRSVFSLMQDYYSLAFTEVDSDDDVDEERTAVAAWEVCERVFRGTTGESVGAVFTRDQVYFDGNVGIWKLLIDKPHVFESLFVGKFDPLLKSHVSALQSLEILPEW